MLILDCGEFNNCGIAERKLLSFSYNGPEIACEQQIIITADLFNK